jgi:DDE family transposase
MVKAAPLSDTPPVALTGWELIVAELPDGWRDDAKKHKILTMRRPPTGAKLTEVDQVLRLILSHVGLDRSLRTTTGAAAASGALPALSAVSLHQWMRKAGPWIGGIVAKVTSSDLLFAASSWHGFDVIVADGTVVTRPGSKGTDARVHYAVRLSNFTYAHCEVTDEHGGEKLSRFPMAPGQLWVVDRGYANPPALAFAREQGGDLLVRYAFGALPLYDEEGDAFDVHAAAATLTRAGDMGQWSVWVHPKKGLPIGVRLVVSKLPAEQATKARARLREEHGKDVPPDREALADYVVLVTTVGEKALSCTDLMRLYRLRWQVERIIKQDKSLGGLDRLPNLLPETIGCWLNAKMLLAALARRLALRATEPAFPP